MDHDHRTADTGMLGSETESPDPAAIPRAPSEPAATTRESHPVATDMSDADADRTRLGTHRTSNRQPLPRSARRERSAVLDHHPDHDLLRELEPVAEQLLDRHLSMARTGSHEYMPWSLGRDFDNEPWTPHQLRLTGVAQAAFEVNLVTQDSPAQLWPRAARTFGRDGGLDHLVVRWTAEEGRLAVVLRDYLLVTRNIDLVALDGDAWPPCGREMPDKTTLSFGLCVRKRWRSQGVTATPL